MYTSPLWLTERDDSEGDGQLCPWSMRASKPRADVLHMSFGLSCFDTSVTAKILCAREGRFVGRDMTRRERERVEGGGEKDRGEEGEEGEKSLGDGQPGLASEAFLPSAIRLLRKPEGRNHRARTGRTIIHMCRLQTHAATSLPTSIDWVPRGSVGRPRSLAVPPQVT